jgi:hypothetical protein
MSNVLSSPDSAECVEVLIHRLGAQYLSRNGSFEVHTTGLMFNDLEREVLDFISDGEVITVVHDINISTLFYSDKERAMEKLQEYFTLLSL